MKFMKKEIASILLMSAVAVAPLAFTGCAVTQGRETVGAYAKDKEIETRIKTAMYASPEVKGTQVSVSALNGVVQLSGFAESQEAKNRAGQIAESVPGVVAVHNDILLPTGRPTIGNPNQNPNEPNTNHSEPNTNQQNQNSSSDQNQNHQ